MIKRLFDLALAIPAALVLLLPVASVALAVQLTSPGPALYWSDRVGRHNKIFKMPKFRSMRVDTPAVATHLLTDPAKYLTPIGSFLRKSSLDELPQLWSIIKGDMSFVGPRPALFNQHDLIALRTEHGAYSEVFIHSPAGNGIGRLIVDPYSLLLFSSRAEDFNAINAKRAAGHSCAGLRPAGRRCRAAC